MCEFILSFGQWFQKRCCLKLFFLFQGIIEQNHLYNVGKGYFEKHLCEIILKLIRPVVQEINLLSFFFYF